MTVYLVEKAKRRNSWVPREIDGLSLVLSPMLEEISFLTHAFTTREGGRSAPPLDSFNLGRHWPTTESREDAMSNRERLLRALDIATNDLAVPGQKHTDNIEYVGPNKESTFSYPDVDALCTDLADKPILLHFADCVPVVIVDTRKKSLAVVHAGWRGTARSITRKAVSYMIDSLDCRAMDMVAAVGPSICARCYQTDDSVARQVCQTVSQPSAFVETRGGRPYPDLPGINAMQLLESGLELVDVSNWCTACHPELFYSHRQSGGQTGRQGALACLR